MEILIAVVIGILVGMYIIKWMLSVIIIGNLKIEENDPDDGPYLFLELEKDLVFIAKQKYVLVRVKTNSDHARK